MQTAPLNTNTSFRWRDVARAIWFLLGDRKKRYVFFTALLIAILFYDVVPALLVGKIIDFFGEYNAGEPLTRFYALVAFLGVSYAAVSLVRLTSKKNLKLLQSEVNYTTRVNGFERLLDFSVKWHDNENTGNKVQRIQNGTDALRDLQSLLSSEVFPQVTQVIGVFAVLLVLQPIFFVYCLVYIGIFAWLHLSFSAKFTKLTEESNMYLERASGTYFEGLSNVLTIKTLGVKDDFKRSVMSKEELSRDYAMKRTILVNNKWKSFQVINGLSIGGIMLLAGFNFISGAITIGSIFIIFTYFQKLSGALGDSMTVIDKLVQNKISIGRMMPIFWEEEIKSSGSLSFPHEFDGIHLKDVSFAYPAKGEGRQPVGLSNLSVSIRRNEKIGIVGLSGSGKSTFAKLLLGLYKVDSGEYLIGRTSFYDIAHENITHSMALVLQESEMFNLTLRENITLMRKLDQQLLDQTISIASLESLIAKLPQGLDTMIGEKGYRLSGGERQRIGLARALYKDPEVLVLDEATSSLDSKTETAILKALEQKLTKKTVISIAHRISTLKSTDRILVFDQGSVVEEGTHGALSKDKTSKFYEISHVQK